ncbi:MAG: leucyl/phenylalanyl-tRNA--protein transferase [Gammaproteobacteria bacterium]|nr:leucyl/phenylalanyl-tRNA--protein transferase [Gammaproteobacteria bacterium]
MTQLYWIPQGADPDDFPPLKKALKEPDGLLAAGGDLSLARLATAYWKGIFPWYSDGEPILWWSPDPRMVLFPEQLKVSRSLEKNIRNGNFSVSVDKAFRDVIKHCAAVPRLGQDGTWITADMQAAYIKLHLRGLAHSVECWREGRLVGGLYGVAIGRVFFGESMFSLVSNASKVAFVRFVRYIREQGYALIDCQVHTPHMESLGAVLISRKEFRQCLKHWCKIRGVLDGTLSSDEILLK